MNLLDLIIIVVFLGMFVLGFFVGVGRTLALLVSMLVGLVGASVFYRAIADLFVGISDQVDIAVANLVAFILLALIIAAAVDYLLMRSFRVSRLRTRLTLETRGGFPAILLVIAVAFLFSVTLVITLVQLGDRSTGELPDSSIARTLEDQFHGSILSDQALRFAPVVYHVVSTLTPGSVPEILEPWGDGPAASA